MIRAVNQLRNASTETQFYILSNSNTVYITTILEVGPHIVGNMEA